MVFIGFGLISYYVVCLRRGRLEEVNLQEALEIEVRHVIAVLDAEELTELGIRNDAALERRVKATVRLDIACNELRDIRLAALGLGGKTHERGKLIADWAELEESVVCTAGLPCRLLLRRHVLWVLALATLGVADITLESTCCIRCLQDQSTNTRRELRAKSLEVILELCKNNCCTARLGRCNYRCNINDWCTLDYWNGNLGLGGNTASRAGLGLRGWGWGWGGGGGGGRGGLGLLLGWHLVCFSNSLRCLHF